MERRCTQLIPSPLDFHESTTKQVQQIALPQTVCFCESNHRTKFLESSKGIGHAKPRILPKRSNEEETALPIFPL